MVRFTRIVLAYIVIGSVMWVGGAIAWDDAGAATFLADVDGEGNVSPAEEPVDQSRGVGSAVSNVIDQFSGPLVIVWNVAVKFIGYLNWPMVVLITNNAPPSAVVMLGVPLNGAFYLSLIVLLRSSA